MKPDFLRSLEEMRGVHFLLQDNKLVFTRFDTMSSGHPTEQVIGSPLSEVIAPECIEEVLQLHSNVIKDRKKNIFYYNTQSLAKDGSRVPVRCAVWATTYQNKPAIAGVMARIRDEDQSASLALKTADRFGLLLTGAAKAGEGIAAFEYGKDDALLCVYANEEVERISGYSLNELKGMSFSSLFDAGIEDQQADGPLRYESEVHRKDGGKTPIELCIGMAKMAQTGQLTIIYIRDITERKGWESRNLMLQRALRFYARQVVKAQEEERKRLARELHDSTIQSLLSIAHQLQDAESISGERLQNLCEVVDHTISDVRDFTWGLRPPLLDDMGLAPTLRWLVDKVSQSGDLDLKISVSGKEKRLETNIELAVFRITQEAISNIQRHSHATTARVALDFGETRISLSITDDGCGFDSTSGMTGFANAGKLGLIGMNERSLDIDATIEIESTPGEGTRISVVIPTPHRT